MSVNVIAT